jgi:hypothetical protein
MARTQVWNKFKIFKIHIIDMGGIEISAVKRRKQKPKFRISAYPAPQNPGFCDAACDTAVDAFFKQCAHLFTRLILCNLDIERYTALRSYYYGGGGVSQLTGEKKIDYREYLYSGTM